MGRLKGPGVKKITSVDDFLAGVGFSGGSSVSSGISPGALAQSRSPVPFVLPEDAGSELRHYLVLDKFGRKRVMKGLPIIIDGKWTGEWWGHPLPWETHIKRGEQFSIRTRYLSTTFWQVYLAAKAAFLHAG